MYTAVNTLFKKDLKIILFISNGVPSGVVTEKK